MSTNPLSPTSDVSDVQAKDFQPAEAVKTNKYLRQAYIAIGCGFLGFFLWAALAPLDEGVPAQGSVMIDNKRKTIQHLQGGIIRELKIGEGALVDEGQVLVVLEQATAKANMESVRQHYFALRATEGRLLAELGNKSKISFHNDLEANSSDLYVQQHINANERLFQARKSLLQTSLAIQKEAQEATRAQIKGLESVLQEKNTQLELMSGQLERLKPLVSEGYAPRVQQIDLERLVAEIRAQSADVHANLQRAAGQERELDLKTKNIQQDYYKEASQLLSEINRELLAEQDKLVASKQDLRRTEIIAPAKGQVVGLAPVTPGSVIGPGQKIMDIIPEKAELIVEARIQPQVIDRINPKQLADIRFSAFSHSPLLMVEGKVESISKDLLTDPDLKQSYYLARISLTQQGRDALGDRELTAGLPAEVMIKTGARSLMSYLTYPLVRRLHKSMKEE